MYLVVSISSPVKLLVIETNNVFFIFFGFAFEIFIQGPWYQILHVLPCFSHMIMVGVFHFQDGGDVTNPAGLSLRILPWKCKSGPMPPSWAKSWRQLSQQIPRYFPLCPWGQLPRMASDECIISVHSEVFLILLQMQKHFSGTSHWQTMTNSVSSTVNNN